MVERLYLTLQMLAVILWLYNVFDRKFRFNLCNVTVVLLAVLTMRGINYYRLAPAYELLIYVELFAFCLVEFRMKLLRSLIRYAVALLIVFIAQIVIGMPVFMINKQVGLNYDTIYLCINVIFFIVTALLLRWFKVGKILNKYGRTKLDSLGICILFGVLVIIGLLIYVRTYAKIQVSMYFSIAVVMIALYIVLYHWLTTDYQLRQAQMEYEMERMYDGAYQNLVDTARSQQHDFHNHIQALLSIANAGTDSEQIAKEQNAYCEDVMNMLSDSKLLCGTGRHPLAGFIYNKITQARAKNIQTQSCVLVDQCEVGIPLYQIVEMIGILLDNAYEEAEKFTGELRRVRLELLEMEGMLRLRVANPTEIVSAEQFLELIKVGKSTKGEGRGVGLAKIDRYCDQYYMNWQIEVGEKESQQWIDMELDIGENTNYR